MIPTGESVREPYGISDFPLTEEGNAERPAELLELFKVMPRWVRLTLLLWGGVCNQGYTPDVGSNAQTSPGRV